MRRWLLLVLLTGAVVSAEARPAPQAGGVVWYRHRLEGGGESGDWLALHRERGEEVGVWLRYQVGPGGKPSLECQPFMAEAAKGSWQVSTCAWDGGVLTWLRYWAFHVAWGQGRVELVNAAVSSQETNFVFERTAPPGFPTTRRSLVAASLRLMARRMERETPR